MSNAHGGRPPDDPLDEVTLYRTLATQFGVPFASADTLASTLDASLIESLPRAFLEHESIVPVARVGDDVVLATTNPRARVDDVCKALRVRGARTYLVTPTDYRRLWMLADVRRSHVGWESLHEPRVETIDLLTHDTQSREAHSIALFDTLLLEAIAERASDLHLERYGERVRVRLRIDGDLHDLERVSLTPDDLIGLVNVIKINANLDIAERRMPQGGRIRRTAGDRAFDLRVQTQPSLHGEHVVIRLLPQDTRLLSIADLGFPDDVASEFTRLMDSPGGLVLVVGPTGSGKSTTLYSGLQHIAGDKTRKVITIEDPIEYAIADVQQSQVRPELGFAFAQAMRSFVREDPDVILVGEIRDTETALEAIRASQTGHLVLSTLHCNDATDAVQRLHDLGMHPNSVASELLAVFAQRLVKRVCGACRAPAVPDPGLLCEVFGASPPKDFRTFAGTGCALCAGRGTQGRIAAVELLPSTADVRRGISRSLPVDDLRSIARASGLRTMRASALSLVQQGQIPFSELPWILTAERMADAREA